MGIKRPNDPTIVSSLIPYDSVIEQTVGGNAYPAWYRYNFDGYGETNAGDPYDGSSGRGRLWPIFDAERGNYEIAATGTGSAGVALSGGAEGLLDAAGLHLRADLECEHDPAGRCGQSFRLDSDHAGRRRARRHHRFDGAAQLGAGRIHHSAWPISRPGRVLDIPQAVCARYSACVAAAGPGSGCKSMSTSLPPPNGANIMYVTGNTEALGNWNTNLGLPVDFVELSGVEERGQPRRRQRRCNTNIIARTRTAASPGNATRAGVIATTTDR